MNWLTDWLDDIPDSPQKDLGPAAAQLRNSCREILALRQTHAHAAEFHDDTITIAWQEQLDLWTDIFEEEILATLRKNGTGSSSGSGGSNHESELQDYFGMLGLGAQQSAKKSAKKEKDTDQSDEEDSHSSRRGKSSKREHKNDNNSSNYDSDSEDENENENSSGSESHPAPATAAAVATAPKGILKKVSFDDRSVKKGASGKKRR